MNLSYGETRKCFLGGVFKDVFLILVCEPVNRLNNRFQVVEPGARIWVLARTGTRVFCSEHAAVGANDLEQEVQSLFVVENGVKVELP